MTTSNGNILSVTDPLWGESTAHRGSPHKGQWTRSFGVFFDLRLNKRLSKQSKRRWFKPPSRSLWRHCNEFIHFHWRKWMHFNMSSGKWRPSRPDLNVIRFHGIIISEKSSTWWVRAWWRHQMEPFSALLALCAGNSPVSGELPAQRPMTRSFDVFFDLRPNKRLSKQLWG